MHQKNWNKKSSAKFILDKILIKLLKVVRHLSKQSSNNLLDIIQVVALPPPIQLVLRISLGDYSHLNHDKNVFYKIIGYKKFNIDWDTMWFPLKPNSEDEGVLLAFF